ncbi:hypothetical protein ACMFMG_000332 [Clarireedia jacksonii]
MGNTLSEYKETECEIDIGDGRGIIRGLQFDSKARRFLGIPYAIPPTGDLRWRKPQPLPKSFKYSKEKGEPFDARKFGPICPQALNYTSASKHTPSDSVYDEDCLRLNIWTPVEQRGSKEKWPVMLWLHGGWFQMGDPSHEPGMDPTEMISTGKLNAIVVSIGYRLNLFGFLAGKELQEEGGEVGNYGLWDQRLAIDWVRENISHFGGDPQNITLAGRSAGAYSVHAQTLYEFQNPPTQERDVPFRRIVMISNAIPAQPKTSDECQNQFDELATFFAVSKSLPGTEKLALLRKIGSKELSEAILKLKHHTFRPITDGSFIKPRIMEYHRNGSFAQEFKKRCFKLLIGEMLNEETLYAVTNGPEANVDSLKLQVSNYYAPATTDRVLKHYNLPSTDKKTDWQTVFGNIIADGQVRAPSRFLVNSLYANGVPVEDIWRYRIAYRLSFITDKVAPMSFGVAHAMDKPLWNFSIMHGPTEKERVLMEDWIADLAAFVGDEAGYDYKTRRIDELKVLTPDGRIEIQNDDRWRDLLNLAEVFSG